MKSCVESWFVKFDCWLCCFVAPWYAYTWTILVRLGNHSNRYKLLFQSLIFKMLIKRAHYLDVVTIDSLCPGWSLFYSFHHNTPPTTSSLQVFYLSSSMASTRKIYSCWLSKTKFSRANEDHHTDVSFTDTTWNLQRSSTESVHLIVLLIVLDFLVQPSNYIAPFPKRSILTSMRNITMTILAGFERHEIIEVFVKNWPSIS